MKINYASTLSNSGLTENVIELAETPLDQLIIKEAFDNLSIEAKGVLLTIMNETDDIMQSAKQRHKSQNTPCSKDTLCYYLRKKWGVRKAVRRAVDEVGDYLKLSAGLS